MSGSTLVGLRLGSGPNDKRDTPDVLSRGTCRLVPEMLLRDSEGAWRDCDGVVSSPAALEVVDPTVRLRLRIVTVDGTLVIPRGDERGGVVVGAGSLDRAECTRASRRCIWAVSVRMCVSEFDVAIR
jgi:hypothetical protein